MPNVKALSKYQSKGDKKQWKKYIIYSIRTTLSWNPYYVKNNLRNVTSNDFNNYHILRRYIADALTLKRNLKQYSFPWFD